MRLASVAVLALFSSVALVGCGDDSGGISISDAASTTTAATDDTSGGDTGGDADDRDALIDYVIGGDTEVIDEEAAGCVADVALPDMSADGIAAVRDSVDFDLTELPSDDADLIVAGLDECVDIDAAVDAFAAGIASEDSFPLTDEEASCAAAEFAQEYEGAGHFIEAISAMSEDESGQRLFIALGPCMSPESATTFMTTLLADQGMGDELSACVAAEIVAELGVAPLLEAIAESGSGGDTSVLESASTNAGATCAGEGLGGDSGSIPVPSIGGGLSGN